MKSHVEELTKKRRRTIAGAVAAVTGAGVVTAALMGNESIETPNSSPEPDQGKHTLPQKKEDAPPPPAIVAAPPRPETRDELHSIWAKNKNGSGIKAHEALLGIVKKFLVTEVTNARDLDAIPEDRFALLGTTRGEFKSAFTRTALESAQESLDKLEALVASPDIFISEDRKRIYNDAMAEGYYSLIKMKDYLNHASSGNPEEAAAFLILKSDRAGERLTYADLEKTIKDISGVVGIIGVKDMQSLFPENTSSETPYEAAMRKEESEKLLSAILGAVQHVTGKPYVDSADFREVTRTSCQDMEKKMKRIICDDSRSLINPFQR